MSEGVWFETLESRRLFTGVTLVTHGYGASAADWVTQMGDAIAAQSGPLASQPRYLMTAQDIGHDGGPITVTSTRLGPAPADWGSSEIIVLLDWSDLAGGNSGGTTRNTYDVGAAVADKFLASFSIPDLAEPLAELPIHLIGHSRGGSLISELAKDLGQHGVWVDQVTYLDPHPVDGIRDPFLINFGDAPMHVYDNIQYAEDYWRTDGDNSFDFTGEPVNGAYNLQLNETTLSNGGYSTGQHSDVHLWYHGTIPPYANSDGSASIGTGWYNPPQGPRDQLGFKFSRIAKGTRPTAGLKSSGAFRDALTLSVSGANVYDNIAIDGLLTDTTVTQGTSIPISTRFEDKSTGGGTRDATITLGFDRDDNPFNGVYGSGVTFLTSSLGSDTLNTSIPTGGIAGGFHIYAKISNGVTTRYYYAPGRAIVTLAGMTQTWIGPASGGAWMNAANWSGNLVPAASDRVGIFDSAVALSGTIEVADLTLPGGSKLDLGTNNLIVNYSGSSPLTAISALIASARDGGAWDTPGLTSSVAAASHWLTSLGVGEASDIYHLSGSQTTSLGGQSVDATSVIVKYTYAGDGDCDGRITANDYFLIDAGYLGAGAPAPKWSNGDFDFNVKVNGDDYFLIDKNYADQTGIL